MNLDQLQAHLAIDVEGLAGALDDLQIELKDEYSEQEVERIRRHLNPTDNLLVGNIEVSEVHDQVDSPKASVRNNESSGKHSSTRQVGLRNIDTINQKVSQQRSTLAGVVKQRLETAAKAQLAAEEQAANGLAMILDPDLTFARIQTRAIEMVNQAKAADATPVEMVEPIDVDLFNCDIVTELMEINYLALAGTPL